MQKTQQGFTFMSFLAAVLIVAFLIMGVLRALPAYIEHLSISNAFAALGETFNHRKSDATTLDKAAIRTALQRSFKHNDITHLPLSRIAIEKINGTYSVTANYDIRVHFIANIDFIFHFHNHMELSRGK